MYKFNFDFEQFLADYWHKKPVIIKNAFADFVDPITPDELAGLAMEEEIDSRFVSCLDSNWQVMHGPFEDFSAFADTHSQLIIQAANHWHRGVDALATPFRVLPQWLFDDVMICLSMPHGGVGPHIDQYDVFIIQGMGKRHWKVGNKGQYQDANHHTGLKQITGFDPIIDDILMPGDLLYIPPGFPHEGSSIDVSMSYSVGYRSPTAQELLSGFADYCIAHELGDVHFAEPNLTARPLHGEIPTQESAALDAMLIALLQNPTAKARWLGEQLSQPRHELDIMPADPAWTAPELKQFLTDGLELEKVAGLKTLYHQNDPCSIFINGESINLPAGSETFAFVLCNQQHFTGHDLGKNVHNVELMELLLELCNQGLWFPK